MRSSDIATTAWGGKNLTSLAPFVGLGWMVVRGVVSRWLPEWVAARWHPRNCINSQRMHSTRASEAGTIWRDALGGRHTQTHASHTRYGWQIRRKASPSVWWFAFECSLSISIQTSPQRTIKRVALCTCLRYTVAARDLLMQKSCCLPNVHSDHRTEDKLRGGIWL